MKTKGKKYKRLLSRKILLGCAVFSIFLCFILGAFGALIYSRGMMEKYETYMKGILRYTLAEIDGNDLEKCIRTGEKSEGYKHTQEVLDQIKENYDIAFIYIVKPLNTNDKDNMMNVMAGATDYEKEHEKDTLVELGELTQDAYSSKVAANYLARMNTNSVEISYFSNKTDFGHDYTGLVPILNSNGEAIAILAVDISVNEIQNVLTRYIIIILIGMTVFLGIFLTGLYRWLGKKIITPISKIQTAAEKFVAGSHEQENSEKIFSENPELSAELEKIHTGDEIESLANSFIKMENDIRQYVENLALATATKEHMAAEFNVAKQIQQNLFPCQFPAFPERKDFDIYASLHTCDAIGGNFYNFFLIDDDHLCILLGDVSGNGIPTSMFSVIATTLISHYAAQKLSPDKILFHVNNDLSRDNHAELTVDAFLAIINLETGKLSYSTAGNMNSLLKSPGSEFETLPSKKCFPLAAMAQVHYIEQEFPLSQGDILFLHTKGISESVNEKGLVFGADYAKEKITELVTQEYSLNNMTEEFYRFLNEFQNGAPQSFDSTILIFRYTGK